ncbi:MAG: hypothetical protein FWG72_02770 [Oscillospiraceae bacterium]|nr:hypothetical protein [Oscillospiraceae bacterium]
MKAILSKHIDPRCIYCKRSEPLNVKEMACVKRGVVDAYGRCRAFRYDPLKRVPPRPAKLGKDYTAEDLTI